MKRRGLTCFFVCFIVLFAAVASGQNYVGTLNDAPYKIRVPENWNGTLLMYAHGYGYLERWNPVTQFDYSYADATPGGAAMESFLLGEGYALAGTVFSGTGWQVKEGTHQLVSLAGLFNGLVGKPKRTILIGYSLGSLIAMKSAEEVPVYDGIIAGCTVGAGTLKAFELVGGYALAYHTLFGWPEQWGAWYDVRNDIKFYQDEGVFPVLYLQVTNPANFPKFEFLRLLFDAPLEGFYPDPVTGFPGWLFLDMFFATEARAELEVRAKGPVISNSNHRYDLDSTEKGYLSGMGLDVEGLLAAMNASTNISISPAQRQYLEKYFSPTGELKKPVISMHAVIDGLVGNYHESVLLEQVTCAQSENMLLQLYTNDIGHCTFGPYQLLQAIQGMHYWLDNGTKPGSDFFTEFNMTFTPGAWPIGQKSPAPLCSATE